MSLDDIFDVYEKPANWAADLANPSVVRTFDTGANRDTDNNKPDPEGFISPLVIRAFNEYMHENRFLKDGSMRASDNWQKGIPNEVLMKSLWRHFLDVWTLHRGYPTEDYDGNEVDLQHALCGVLFNAMGMLYNLERECL